MTKQIELTQGKYTTVDDADFDELSQYKWCYHKEGYAQRRKGDRPVFMHRELLGAGRTFSIDHINGDGLDNQRCNLRLVTAAQNQRNRRKMTGTSSKYKGVIRHSDGKSWQAQIRVDGKLKYLGFFQSEQEAAKAYDAAAVTAWGDYARPNFPNVTAIG